MVLVTHDASWRRRCGRVLSMYAGSAGRRLCAPCVLAPAHARPGVALRGTGRTAAGADRGGVRRSPGWAFWSAASTAAMRAAGQRSTGRGPAVAVAAAAAGGLGEQRGRARAAREPRQTLLAVGGLHGDASQLANLDAVTDGYPLRGHGAASPTAVRERRRGTDAIPAPGEAWPDSRLLAALGAKRGHATRHRRWPLSAVTARAHRPTRSGLRIRRTWRPAAHE